MDGVIKEGLKCVIIKDGLRCGWGCVPLGLMVNVPGRASADYSACFFCRKTFYFSATLLLRRKGMIRDLDAAQINLSLLS